jgi:aliphatic nitrilase
MTTRLAAAHVASTFFDIESGVQKAIQYINLAAQDGADLVAFPESYLPGFPVWHAFLRPIDAHAKFARFAAASLLIDGPEIARIQDAARTARIVVWLGFSERASYSEGCLWNSAILIGADGEIRTHHRKLVPTFYEKMVWSRGDGNGLRVEELPFGRVGGLICGENGNPLARYSLMAQGEQIHCASYPSVWPFRAPNNGAPYDLAEAIRIRAAAHSFEAKTYTVVSSALLDEAGISAICDGDAEAEALIRKCARASSMIVTPDGSTLGGTLTDTEGLVIADVDLSVLTELKQHHDMAGYYNRHDVFRVEVNNDRQAPLHIVGRPPARTNEVAASTQLDGAE